MSLQHKLGPRLLYMGMAEMNLMKLTDYKLVKDENCDVLAD
jgi:hypothetical protein